jgi:hypothetical protein
MNKDGSFSSLSINMEPGGCEPFKVMLQCHIHAHFLVGMAQSIPQIFIGTLGSAKFKDN